MPDDLPLSTSIRGLIEAEVRARLKVEGYNKLPRPDRRTPFRIILEVIREPMLALLLAFAMLSIVITVVQETRTERVLVL